jgi:hypothetical protein
VHELDVRRSPGESGGQAGALSSIYGGNL